MGICGNLKGHDDKFYNNKVVQLTSGSYASYDCNCKKTGTCPEFHDNQIFTPDGNMADVCGETLQQRQSDGVDIGSSVSKHPSDEMLIEWARELIDLP